MNCSRCGTLAGPNEQFCRSCGTPLTQAYVPAATGYPMVTRPPSVLPGAIIAAIGLVLVATSYFIEFGYSFNYQISDSVQRTQIMVTGIGWLFVALGALLAGVALARTQRAG